MSKLTPAQRQKQHTVRVKQHRLRVKAKKQDAANQAITAPLTAQGLNAETKSATNIRYGAQERDLQGQARAQDRAAANSAGWFQDYRAAVDAATQRSQQNALATSQAIQGLANQSSQVDAYNRNQTLQQQQTSAASRGATVDPSLAGIATQAEASRRASLDNQAAASLRTGQSQTDYLGDQSRIGAGRQVQAAQAIAARKLSIQQQVAALKAEEGDYANQYRANARVTERNNLATQKTLGIQQQKTNLEIVKAAQDAADKAAGRRETHRHDKAGEKNTRRGQDVTTTGQGVTRRGQDIVHGDKVASLNAKKNKKTGGPTDAVKRGGHDHWQAARNNLLVARQKAPHAVSGATNAALIAQIQKNGVPYDIAKAVVQEYRVGGVMPHLHHHLWSKYHLKTPRAKKSRIKQRNQTRNFATGIL